MRIASSAFFAATSLAFAVVVSGCASDVDETTSLESSLTGTRARVVPLDDTSRAACRAEAEQIYCTEAEARAAAARCGRQGANGKVVVSASSGACTATGPAYPTVDACTRPHTLDCSFYSACLERSTPCGAQGYALGFGEKYCTAFRSAKLSPTGQRWVERTMRCLQEALVPEVVSAGEFSKAPASAARCEEVFDKAFASHPACYTAKESSVCFLPPSDVVAVLDTIGIRELLTRRTGAQMTHTVGLCVSQITRRILGLGAKAKGASAADAMEDDAPEAALTREELEAMLAEWKKLDTTAP
jgi:hypothetical protein